MKFNVRKAIEGTIAMNNTGKRVIFPVFMEEEDKGKLNESFARLNDFYFYSSGNKEDRARYRTLKTTLHNLKEELIKKYERIFKKGL